MIKKFVFIGLDQAQLDIVAGVVESFGAEIPPFEFVAERLSFDTFRVHGIDAVITPGNSYGHMSGGFDGALVQVFGTTLWGCVSQYIGYKYHGELPVGQAFAMDVPSQATIQVVYAPTMRVPKAIPLPTDVPYLAMRAALLAIHTDPFVNTVLVTGMGTSTGGVPYNVMAHQMCTAIKQVLSPVVIQSDLFGVATEFDKEIYRGQLCG